jgi:hypothetical protein
MSCCDRTTPALTATASTQIVFPQIRIGGGATAPTLIEAGPTLGWLFTIGDLLYCEVPLPSNVDRTQPVVIGIAWAPSGSEVGKTVRWQTDIGFEENGALVTAISDTRTADAAVPAVAATYVRTGISIPAATWAADPDTDEFHIRVTRVASAGAEPVAEPGIHHIAVIFPIR